MQKLIYWFFFALSMSCSSVFAKGTLSENWRIDSKQLGYALQYRVYFPEGMQETDKLPTIYVTDGQWYISEKGGRMIEVLDREIAAGNIKPIIAIFVDNRDPDDLHNNRRNDQFQCNKDYASFYIKELIPTISSNFPVSDKRDDRVIAGVSFGGLNAACFGLMASQSFAGIGMHSPANREHLKLLSKMYKRLDVKPVKMFMSVGTRNDNMRAGRKFHGVLKEKGYDVNYVEVPYGHVWDNWRPLIDDLLMTFFKK